MAYDEKLEQALARRLLRQMDFTGRPLNGYVYLGPVGHRSAQSLRDWVERGVKFSRSLPPK